MVISSLVPKGPQPCLCLPGPCPHSAPRISPQVVDMSLSSRTQPRLSSPHSGAAFVTRVPEQSGPCGQQASTKPGQMQTARLAPRFRSTGALERAGCPLPPSQQTIHPVEGPRQSAPLLGAQDTQQKSPSLPLWEPAVRISEAVIEGPDASSWTKRAAEPGAKKWSVKGW